MTNEQVCLTHPRGLAELLACIRRLVAQLLLDTQKLSPAHTKAKERASQEGSIRACVNEHVWLCGHSRHLEPSDVHYDTEQYHNKIIFFTETTFDAQFLSHTFATQVRHSFGRNVTYCSNKRERKNEIA